MALYPQETPVKPEQPDKPRETIELAVQSNKVRSGQFDTSRKPRELLEHTKLFNSTHPETSSAVKPLSSAETSVIEPEITPATVQGKAIRILGMVELYGKARALAGGGFIKEPTDGLSPAASSTGYGAGIYIWDKPHLLHGISPSVMTIGGRGKRHGAVRSRNESTLGHPILIRQEIR